MSILALGEMRRTIRSEVNPLDKSTIISIYPQALDEKKPTISPGRFIIPPGSVEKPVFLTVGPSSWWRDIDIEQPLLEIVNSSMQVANSIVIDYCNGLLGCNMRDSMPGLFWVPGEFTSLKSLFEYKDKHDKFVWKTKFESAVLYQTNYWKNLVKLADIGWTKTNGNPLSISDDMKRAASLLGLKDKPWMKDFQQMELVHCIACGSLRNPAFPICGNCKAVIDKVKAKELDIKFAE
jgi:hypothetical protein